MDAPPPFVKDRFYWEEKHCYYFYRYPMCIYSYIVKGKRWSERRRFTERLFLYIIVQTVLSGDGGVVDKNTIK